MTRVVRFGILSWLIMNIQSCQICDFVSWLPDMRFWSELILNDQSCQIWDFDKDWSWIFRVARFEVFNHKTGVLRKQQLLVLLLSILALIFLKLWFRIYLEFSVPLISGFWSWLILNYHGWMIHGWRVLIRIHLIFRVVRLGILITIYLEISGLPDFDQNCSWVFRVPRLEILM